ncbi:MAG: sialidase family protein [Jatrophihabitans sp.]
MRRSIGFAAAATALALLALPLAVSPGASPAHATGISYNKLSPLQQRLLSGSGTLAMTDTPSSSIPKSSFRHTSISGGNGCQDRLGSNLKVNANCQNITDADLAGRGEANNGTSIAYDPNNPRVMVASANDYRTGDSNCYTSYSTDGGHNWQDSTPPTSFTRGQVPNVVDFGASREYWDAASGTSVAFDTKGNAYLSCLLFTRAQPTANSSDISSAIVVSRSTQNGGASWNFPGRYVRASADVTGTGIPPFLDRPLLAVDNHVGSPYQDRVYESWTEFASDGTTFIYASYSSNYGETFAAPKLVSTTSPMCVKTFGAGTVATTGESSTCNENQLSQPFTGKDGNLYIVYDNFNNSNTANPSDNRNQVLLSKSVDGGNTFLPPIKVSDFYDLPDCATYQAGQGAGRACTPEKGSSTNSYFRAFNYPSGAVDPTDPSKVVVAIGSYINQHSNESNGCVPTGFSSIRLTLYTGVKTLGACNNDIMLSVSNNKGATFTGSTRDPRVMPVVTTAPGQATTDQWLPWVDFTKKGKLAISYYDRQYGTDETTGFSDVSLSGSDDLTHFGIKRVTSSSMPPPTEFAGTFYGDYSGMVAPDDALPLWTDTRTPELFLCPGTGTTGVAPKLCTAGASNAAVANDQELRIAILPVPGH